MAYDWLEIDWSDHNAKIGPHFRVHEALWLPSWRIYHIPSDEEKANIVRITDSMELIRGLLGAAIIVHCWIRPLNVNAPDTPHHGENYNRYIGSRSTKSAHIFGRAVDFHVSGYSGPEKCALVRQQILPYLEDWNIRMEDIEGGWVHIDDYPVGHQRFYKP